MTKPVVKFLASGFFFLASFSLTAQQGSTPVPGHNPVPPGYGRLAEPPSPLDGNNTLGPTYQNNMCGLDYTTASNKIGQRVSPPGVTQPASFPIAGIPPTATIQKAFIWCDASGTGIPITLSVTNPASVTNNYNMTLIGTDQDKCWSYQGTYSYRADVTAAISGNGNYVISGFPTNPPTSGNDVDGATMMVIWSDNSATFQGDIEIWDGALVVNGGTTTQNVTGFTNTCSNATYARGFMCVADLQGLGAQLSINSSPPFTITEDWWNYIDQTTTVTAGQNSAAFNVNSSGDCYNFCMMGLYFRTTCSTCCNSPYTLTMASTPANCATNNGTATATPNAGTAPYTYTWNTTPTQNTATATNLAPGQYIVVVQDASGCSTVDTVNVAATGSLNIAPASSNVTCNGGSNGNASVSVVGGTAPYTYSWSPNVSSTGTASNLTAGTYTVNISDNFGCTATQSFTITEPALVPLVATASNDTTICTGGSVTLSATAAGGSGAPYTFGWLGGLGSTSTITVAPTTTTTYTVIINDQCNTPTDTDTVQVVVNQLPVVTFTGSELAGCSPVCPTFTDNSTPASTSCFWDFDDQTNSTNCNPSHCFYAPGSYNIKLTVIDINGCTNSLTLNNYINVYPFPVPGFTAEYPVTLLDPYVAFTNTSVGGDTCYWDFGDGTLLTVPGCTNTAHNYQDTGSYHVMQIVENQWGCRDTIWSDVVVLPYATLYIPNTFTPNNNGKNDVFKVYGEYMTDFQMLIFDRWGNQIFKSNDMNIGWDGRANGGNFIAQEDTYVYVITCKENLYGEHFHRYIGHVNLIK